MKTLRSPSSLVNRNRIFDLYAVEISRYPILTAEQEFEMFKRYRNGELSVRDEIVKSNLRFVVLCAKQYTNCGIPICDLVNEGNIGLMEAVEKFDHTRGFKFISYGVMWIQNRITSSISKDSRTVRLPMHVVKHMAKVKKAAGQVEEDLGYVDEAVVADVMGLDEQTIHLVLDDRQPKSLEGPVSEDSDTPLIDLLNVDGNDSLDVNHVRETFDQILGSLTSREADIIKRSYGLAPYDYPQTAEIIAAAYEYNNQQSVSYVTTKAMRTIRGIIQKQKITF